MNLYELHERMTGHLFPAYSNTDERFLALALCGEAGEMGELVEDPSFDNEEARDELADCRVYLELLAKCFDIEGDKLPVHRLKMGDVGWHNGLVLRLCTQSGLLANLIKKRWRDNAKNDDACRGKIIEIRNVIEQIAWCFGIEGDKLDARVLQKLEKVVEKHKHRLTVHS